MAGLLDFMQSPQGIGLLSAVAGGLAGARRGTPFNNVGRGLVSGLTGYQVANDQIRQDQENALMRQYKEMQMQQIQQQIADQQAKREAGQAAAAKAMKSTQYMVDGKPFTDRTAAQAAAMPNEATQLMASSMGSQAAPMPIQEQQGGIDPAMYRRALYEDLLQRGQVDEAMKYAPREPKWTIGEVFDEATGMRKKVVYDENNPSDMRPFGGVEADTVVTDNLGGQLVYRGSRSATPLGVAQRTVSPDAQLSAATTRRGQDITNANAAAARAVTIRGQDLPPKATKGGPMSATLQKELLESDDTAQASANIIRTLDAALEINDKAYSGYGAKPRAVLRSNLPFQSEAADATINLDNMMTGQALESLKMIFGGMPTEGERKILLDMQASADKTPAQRKAILERAKAAAQRRGQYAAQKARAIRNGTYLTDGVPAGDENDPLGLR